MGSSFAGLVLDPTKCSKLSMDEKRELLRELLQWPQVAPEMLKSWSRRQILEVLCAEMGKERKYTGLSKDKLIELLLKVSAEKKSENCADQMESESNPSPAIPQRSSKRQRKMEHPSRVAFVTTELPAISSEASHDKPKSCRNSACRATIRPQDAFCKRCSCCICHQYDDNKDPSVWLVCNSEPPYQADSCGMSCHLECAFRHERTGISLNGNYARLDGCFYCVSCRKMNDLLGCWRKQLLIAKDARRVDVLCYRISLSHKILRGTEKYQKLHEIVDMVAKKLEAEVGSLDGLPIKMARGIVNRLSSGAEIHKLCASAVKMLDSMTFSVPQPSSACNVQESCLTSPTIIRFEHASPTSVAMVLDSKGALSEEIVGYNLWHKKAGSADYPKSPTSVLYRPSTIFSLSDLTPSTEYIFKIHPFSKTRLFDKCEVRFTTSGIEDVVTKKLTVGGDSTDPHCGSPRTNCSSLSNPSSEGDESNNKAYGDQNNSPGSCSGNCEKPEIPDMGKSSESAYGNVRGSQDTSIIIPDGPEPAIQEGTPGDSVSALDEEHIVGDAQLEPNSKIQSELLKDPKNSSNGNQAAPDVPKCDKNPPSKATLPDEMSIENESDAPMMAVVPFGPSESTLPVTPSKPEMGNRVKPISGVTETRPTRPEKDPQAGSSLKKRSLVRCEETCEREGSTERDYEYCVKVVRWLECEGHIEKNFRVKFLTWFSLRATPQERRIVNVYVDTLLDDPASLAGQLIDTFSEGIYSKRPASMPTGFCMRLYH